MKIPIAVMLLLVAFESKAQTTSLPQPGLYLVSIVGGNITYVRQDSSLIATRYVARNGYILPVQCPPSGFTQPYVDSVAAANYLRGLIKPIGSAEVHVTLPNGRDTVIQVMH